MTIAPATAPETVLDARLRPLLVAAIVVLAIEFLLGTANNLWLTLPDSGSGWSTATPSWLVMVHVVLGVLIVVLAVYIAVLAVRSHASKVTAASHTGALGILIAFGAGFAFMGQVQSTAASFIMAVGCGLAIAAYATALYLSGSVAS
jgi:hypothetical protein